MKSIAGFSMSKALLIASAWPMLLLLAVAVVYAAFELTLRDEASRAGPSASADIVVSITSWPLAIAILFAPPSLFLGVWAMVRVAGPNTDANG